MAKLIVTTRSIQQHRRQVDSKYFIKVKKKGEYGENGEIEENGALRCQWLSETRTNEMS